MSPWNESKYKPVSGISIDCIPSGRVSVKGIGRTLWRAPVSVVLGPGILLEEVIKARAVLPPAG